MKNVTDYRQNEKKITDYRQKKNINRQPTWFDIVGTFLLRNKSCFLFSLFLSKVCMKVNHFKSLFRYLQNFLSSTYLCKIVIKSSRFDFRLFPGLYRALPISCQQLKLIWDLSKDAPLFLFIFAFSEKIQESACALISREQNSVTKNSLTKIRLISKIRLGVSSSTTYFSWLLRWSVKWEELVKDCSKWCKRSRS